MINVYAVNIGENINLSIFHCLMSYLNEDKQERIKKIHRLADVQRTLIADVLIRAIIQSKLGIENKDIVFRKNEYGKPFLKYPQSFHFNISHAGEWVVCAIHQLPLGIDIELIQPIDFRIAERFFSTDEYKELMLKTGSEKLTYFYELWTLKESYIKAIGKGLAIPLNSFTIKTSASKITVESADEYIGYYFKQYMLDNRYKLSVCANKKCFCNAVVPITITELYRKMAKI